MKLIDILNKIAKGEEVRFKIDGEEYHCFKYSNLWGEEEVRWYINEDWLNTEVEIIEEKEIPEPIKTKIGYGGLTYLEDEDFSNGTNGFNHREDVIVSKINEIIDYLQSKGE